MSKLMTEILRDGSGEETNESVKVEIQDLLSIKFK
jgi:hypothetical protein